MHARPFNTARMHALLLATMSLIHDPSNGRFHKLTLRLRSARIHFVTVWRTFVRLVRTMINTARMHALLTRLDANRYTIGTS